VTVRADGTDAARRAPAAEAPTTAPTSTCEYKGIGLDGATHITTAPMFQTGARAVHVAQQRMVAIGRGSSGGGQVTYEVFEVKMSDEQGPPSVFTDAERAYLAGAACWHGSAPRRRPAVPTSRPCGSSSTAT
jgi:hypothetical protein